MARLAFEFGCESGEIVAEGENVALGYWIHDSENNPFRDGRLYTGDIGCVDEDGFIFIVERKSRFLKLNGHRVAMREIANAIQELPSVLEVAVISDQDEHGSEFAISFIVLRPGEAVTVEEIRRHCSRTLQPYAVPREIHLVTALPDKRAW